MERGVLYVIGVAGSSDELRLDKQLLQPLRAAGYACTFGGKRPPADLNPQVILVAGGDLVAGCRSARAVAAHAQVIACLPETDESVGGTCLAAGADDLLSMPPSRTVLLARVRVGVVQANLRAQVAFQQRANLLIDDVASWLANTELAEGLYESAVRVADAFGFTRCAVLVVPGEDPTTIFVVAASDDAQLNRLPLTLDKYPELRTALDGKEPVFIDDTASSQLLGDHAAAAAEHGGRTLLAVPLIMERRSVGALLLRSATTRPPLDADGMRLLRLVARVIGTALPHGRVDHLREQTRRVSLVDYNQRRRLRALEQYRDFFESASDGMVVVDGGGEVLYINRAAEQMTGYARSGLAGKTIQSIVDESQRAGLSDVIAHAATGDHLAAFDLQLVTTSGEPLRASVSTSAVLVEHGALVLSFRDVTVARALEDELRKTKDFLERLIDSTVDAIIAADIKGRVMVFNQGAERLCGYAADAVLGKLPVWHLYPDGLAKQIMVELRSPDVGGGVGRIGPVRREIVTSSGTLVPVSLTASIIYEEGREVATVGILSDLRERESIEQRLAAAQEKLLVTEKQALIADLAGTTAHELNQPLTSVMGYAELLKRRIGPDDPHTKAVDTILREAERMAAIVRKIGKITRYETKAYVGSTTILDLDKSATES